MAKLLLVEDDEHLRRAISVSIENLSHSVVEAPNGKVAREILGTQNFDAIVSDIQMPYFNGVELLEWVNQNCKTPMLLMTGFSHLLETKSAHELGAKEFLAKPFRVKDFVNALNGVLGVESVEKKVIKIDDYCRVSIMEFVAKPKIDFDVFVKLSESKLVKIGHAGTELPKEQIKRFQEKGVKYLYIEKSMFAKLIEFNLSVGQALQKSRIPKSKKLNFLRYSSEVILEKAFVQGIDKNELNNAKDIVEQTLETVVQSDDVFSLLEMLNNHCNATYARGLGCALYSVLIAKKVGFESQLTHSKLSLAGLFQDIGEKEIEKEILETPRHLLTAEGRKIFESHPVRSREILQSLKCFSHDVETIVYQHHEDCAGLGFPLGLTKNQLHPLSKIVQLANMFVSSTIDHEASPEDSISEIESVSSERVDRKYLGALKSLFSSNGKSV